MFWERNAELIILLHTQIKNFNASSGAHQVSMDNASFGRNPEIILVALVKNTAFVGAASTSPYHNHQCDMTNLVLYVDGVQHSRTTH